MLRKDLLMEKEKAFVVDIEQTGKHQELLGGVVKTCGMRAGRVLLEAGQKCSTHSTEAKEEILVFLSGIGKLVIDDKMSLEVSQGKVSYISPHTIHYVQNTGEKPLVYVYCVVPVNNESQ